MCANSLWPLLHSMTSYAQFSLDDWLAYDQANSEYAKTTLSSIQRSTTSQRVRGGSSLVWIHDYQLMSMPLKLRRMLDEEVSLSTTRIAFSFHTPFPTWDVFRLCPWSRDLLVGLLGAHLIVFITSSYAGNFLECCWRVLGAKIDRQDMTVEYDGRNTCVRVLPIGFDYEWFEKAAAAAAATSTVVGSNTNDQVREKIILGVDRLDITKGYKQQQ